MTQKGSRAGQHTHPAQHHDASKSNRPARHESREISCSAVYLHIAPTLIEVAAWPPAGTAAWAALDHGNPAKDAAVLYAGLQWVLAEDVRQDAEHQASKAVSRAGDWGAFARQMLQRRRGGCYIPRTV